VLKCMGREVASAYLRTGSGHFWVLALRARTALGRRRPELLHDSVRAIYGRQAREALSGDFLLPPFCTVDLRYVMSQRCPVRD